MSELIHSHTVKTRKSHICFGCGREFAKGVNMRRDAIKDGGELWTAYLCNSCQTVESELDWDDEYGFSDLRERALEIEKGDTQMKLIKDFIEGYRFAKSMLEWIEVER